MTERLQKPNMPVSLILTPCEAATVVLLIFRQSEVLAKATDALPISPKGHVLWLCRVTVHPTPSSGPQPAADAKWHPNAPARRPSGGPHGIKL